MFFILFALLSFLTLIESTIVYLFKLPELTNIPLLAYSALLLIINFILYKIIFKKLIYFKYFSFRIYLRIKKLRKRVDKSMHNDNSKKALLQHQEKAIKLWRACLKNKDSQLSSSITTSERQIVRNNIMIILSINGMGSTMIIFDIDKEKRCLYEVEISSRVSPEVCNYFDIEMQKRMRNAETARRLLIDEDLDKLIQDEENISLKRKSSINGKNDQ